MALFTPHCHFNVFSAIDLINIVTIPAIVIKFSYNVHTEIRGPDLKATDVLCFFVEYLQINARIVKVIIFSSLTIKIQ